MVTESSRNGDADQTPGATDWEYDYATGNLEPTVNGTVPGNLAERLGIAIKGVQ